VIFTQNDFKGSTYGKYRHRTDFLVSSFVRVSNCNCYWTDMTYSLLCKINPSRRLLIRFNRYSDLFVYTVFINYEDSDHFPYLHTCSTATNSNSSPWTTAQTLSQRFKLYKLCKEGMFYSSHNQLDYTSLSIQHNLFFRFRSRNYYLLCNWRLNCHIYKPSSVESSLYIRTHFFKIHFKSSSSSFVLPLCWHSKWSVSFTSILHYKFGFHLLLKS
jgi:hypothetical protein